MRLARQDFVPVAGDDWYQRRRQDAEGKFFRSVADQGPRKGENGETRQGIYCFTAAGKLLAYRNSQDADVMRETLRQALAAWKRLPASERRPGAVSVGAAGTEDAHFARTPPAGGLIVNVYTRILDRDDKGRLVRGTCAHPGGALAARDHLWLTRADWRSLIPTMAKKGDSFPLPQRIAERLLRFHLVDNTRGEPPFWTREQIRQSRMTLTVTEVTAKTMRLRLEGSALLATSADPQNAQSGFDVRLLGHITYDRVHQSMERFDVLALGDHWGEGKYTGGSRPGRTPLGIVFELSKDARGDTAVPPQAAREISDYLGH